MQNTMMKVHPNIAHIPNIHRAVVTISQLTGIVQRCFPIRTDVPHERIVVLGREDRPITPRDTMLRPEHIPGQAEPFDKYRDSVIGFLAKADECGRRNLGRPSEDDDLLRSTDREGVFYVPDMIGEFHKYEYPELTTFWGSCGIFATEMLEGDTTTYQRIAWYLRDKANRRIPYQLDDSMNKSGFEFGLCGGRKMVSPVQALNFELFNDERTKIAALLFQNGYRINLFGSISVDDFFKRADAWNKGFRGEDFHGRGFSPIEALRHEKGQFEVVLNMGSGLLRSVSYSPQEIWALLLTNAETPEIRDHYSHSWRRLNTI